MLNKIIIIQSSDAGIGRSLYIAKALNNFNYKITLITCDPRDIIDVKKISTSNDLVDIKFIFIKIPNFLKLTYYKFFGRLLIYLWFLTFSFSYFILEKPDIIYSRGPHPFTDITSILYKFFRHKKVFIISDITDLWPDAIQFIEFNPFYKQIIILFGDLVNTIMYKYIDIIVTHNEAMAKILRNKSNKDIIILEGIIDTNFFKPIQKDKLIIPSYVKSFIYNKFTVAYVGLLGPFQDPKIILDLAINIKNDDQIRFLIIGDGPNKIELEKIASLNSLRNILFIKNVPHDEIINYYNIADVCLLTYAQIDFLKIGLPKKFVEYAASGKPIICVSPICEASKLCTKYHMGFHIENSKERIIQTTKDIYILKNDDKLRIKMGKNSRNLAEKMFSIENGGQILKKVIDKLIS